MGNKMLENIGKNSTYYNFVIVFLIDLQCIIDVIFTYIRTCVPAPGTLLFFLFLDSAKKKYRFNTILSLLIINIITHKIIP